MKASKLAFRVGDFVRNAITDEQGHIVRLIESAGLVKAGYKEKAEQVYVVALQPTALWPAREDLWQESVIRRDRLPGADDLRPEA